MKNIRVKEKDKRDCVPVRYAERCTRVRVATGRAAMCCRDGLQLVPLPSGLCVCGVPWTCMWRGSRACSCGGAVIARFLAAVAAERVVAAAAAAAAAQRVVPAAAGHAQLGAVLRALLRSALGVADHAAHDVRAAPRAVAHCAAGGRRAGAAGGRRRGEVSVGARGTAGAGARAAAARRRTYCRSSRTSGSRKHRRPRPAAPGSGRGGPR